MTSSAVTHAHQASSNQTAVKVCRSRCAKSNQTASLRTELVLVDAKHGTLQMSAKLALVRMIAQITNFKFIHCLDIYLFSKYRTKTLNMISIFSLKTANI